MLLEGKGLFKSYLDPMKVRRIVLNTLNFSLDKSSTLSIVGKSGVGKSTLAKVIAQLTSYQGEIYFEKKAVSSMTRKEKKRYLQRIPLIFQDPISSLNPQLNIQSILEEPFRIQKAAFSPSTIKKLLEQVELPSYFLQKRPGECSGGELQRVNIARALALRPQALVCDEILASLDAKNKERMIQLLLQLQSTWQISYLFITHDIAWAKTLGGKMATLKDGAILKTDSVAPSAQKGLVSSLRF